MLEKDTMHIIRRNTELAKLLCAMLRSCDGKNILVSDLEKRDWHIHFSHSAYGSLTSAFCEVVGSPAKGQLIIDMYPNANIPSICGGSLFKQFFRRKVVTAKLLPTYDRAMEMLNELHEICGR